MNMVVHEYVCVDCAFEALRELRKLREIEPAIVVGKEAPQAVIPSLHDVGGDAWKESSMSARHAFPNAQDFFREDIRDVSRNNQFRV